MAILFPTRKTRNNKFAFTVTVEHVIGLQRAVSSCLNDPRERSNASHARKAFCEINDKYSSFSVATITHVGDSGISWNKTIEFERVIKKSSGVLQSKPVELIVRLESLSFTAQIDLSQYVKPSGSATKKTTYIDLTPTPETETITSQIGIKRKPTLRLMIVSSSSELKKKKETLNKTSKKHATEVYSKCGDLEENRVFVMTKNPKGTMISPKDDLDIYRQKKNYHTSNHTVSILPMGKINHVKRFRLPNDDTMELMIKEVNMISVQDMDNTSDADHVDFWNRNIMHKLPSPMHEG